MVLLFETMVIPILEYSCQLWSPIKSKLILKLESVQRSFTHRVFQSSENYWVRLRELDLYSLQRRRERYILIYIFKIVNGFVPNMTGVNKITTHRHIRRGLLCNIVPINNRCLSSLRTIKESSFIIQASRLFNEMPLNLREFTGSVDSFKHALDKWLHTVKDQPSLPHYHQQAAGNSVLEQLAQVRADRW